MALVSQRVEIEHPSLEEQLDSWSSHVNELGQTVTDVAAAISRHRAAVREQYEADVALVKVCMCACARVYALRLLVCTRVPCNTAFAFAWWGTCLLAPRVSWHTGAESGCSVEPV